MFSISFILLVIAIVIVVIFASRIVISSGVRTMTAAEAQSLIGQADVILLDVRASDEYQRGHIDGATLLPLPQLALKAEDVIGDKSKKVIVYCHSGGRSKTAATVLKRKGYQHVYDLGGIVSWPYAIVK